MKNIKVRFFCRETDHSKEIHTYFPDTPRKGEYITYQNGIYEITQVVHSIEQSMTTVICETNNNKL